MSLLSEIISKPVLNLYSGKIEGTIKNACFDRSFKKIQYFKIFDEDEEEYLLYANKVYSVGNSSVVIKNDEAISLIDTQEKINDNNPINLDIYSINGDNLGKLLDIELENNFEVKSFISKNASFDSKSVVNISKAMIINDGDKKIKCSDFKPKIKKPEKVNNFNIIKILPTINEANMPREKTLEVLPFEPQKETFKIYNEPTPQRVVGNGDFLIGRKALKTIYGINNEIIIKKDNIINTKNIESAKKHSKLVELTVFSKIKA